MMISITYSYRFGLVSLRALSLKFRNVVNYLYITIGQISSPSMRREISGQKSNIVKRNDPFIPPPELKFPNDITCPYEYILHVYGQNHFSKFVVLLKPDLKLQDPVLFGLVLEVMDAIHFGAILVDDVADNSLLRKGKPAAHCLYGSSETINRAYLRIMEVISKCWLTRPSLVPFILANLEQIHKGQDVSLVWRRDGFEKCTDRESALETYRECANLKTGALFRLAGQLVYGSHEKDELMSQVGWYCHLQNDCKNIYSSDVVPAKGALAEDLSNKEFSFPIIVALYGSPTSQSVMRDALGHYFQPNDNVLDKRFQAALSALQADETKRVCMQELDSLKEGVSQFAAAWGRTEKMTVA